MNMRGFTSGEVDDKHTTKQQGGDWLDQEYNMEYGKVFDKHTMVLVSPFAA